MVRAGDRVCVFIEHSTMTLACGDKLEFGPQEQRTGDGVPTDIAVTITFVEFSHGALKIDIERAHYARVLKDGKINVASGT